MKGERLCICECIEFVLGRNDDLDKKRYFAYSIN